MKIDYVDKKYMIHGQRVYQEIPANIQIGQIGSIELKELNSMYTRCFETGDAQFFRQQTAEEVQMFFDNELGLPDVMSGRGSHILLCNGELIGFLFALPYGDANLHISCMCVKLEEQSKGYGKLMLEYVERVAKGEGYQSLTLGTEKDMRAYRLYESYGFKVVSSETLIL